MTTQAFIVTQTHFQQLRGCLGICRSCLETSSKTADYRAGLTDLIVALEIAVAMIETNCQLAVDRLRHCATVFAKIAHSWYEGSSCRCRACIKLCEEALGEWREYS